MRLSALLQPSGQFTLPAAMACRASLHDTCCGTLWQKTLRLQFDAARGCLATSDGWLQARVVSNHGAHHEFWEQLGSGADDHLQRVRQQTAQAAGVDAAQVAQLATAVDLLDTCIVSRHYGPLQVVALVSAGVHSNAQRAGVDGGSHIEGWSEDGDRPLAGTINIILLSNIILSAAALARSLITITEAKCAALQDLAIPSSYSPEALATGTGTDSIIVVSGSAQPSASYTGGHARIGELMAGAVHAAVMEGLGQAGRP